MALISMAVHDTPENGRTEFTKQTLFCLGRTVDWSRHRLVIVNNGSCPATVEFLAWAVQQWRGREQSPLTVIHNPENRGTARALNQAWQLRAPGQHVLKCDNDVEIHPSGWLDQLEECLARDPQLGIIGCKRKDCIECPSRPEEWWRSELLMLPHEPGQRWLVIEKVRHVMGTCQLYSSALLDKIGYLYQMGGLYGWDDCLSGVRCAVAGFYSAFLPSIAIDHIDPGGTEYTRWKQESAGERSAQFDALCQDYLSGRRSVYHGPEDEP